MEEALALKRAATPAAWSPPATVDEYRLLKQVGRGGMGSVFLAHDTLLDRMVAVKFIGAAVTDSASPRDVLGEARAAARIQHPNVVSTYRVGELSGRPFIVSEFVRGRALDSLPKPMPWERVLTLAMGLARGLAAAHRHGVLHRDIKPSNAILSDDGDVKLVDFGLAEFVETGIVVDEVALYDDSEPFVAASTAEQMRLGMQTTLNLDGDDEHESAMIVADIRPLSDERAVSGLDSVPSTDGSDATRFAIEYARAQAGELTVPASESALSIEPSSARESYATMPRNDRAACVAATGPIIAQKNVTVTEGPRERGGIWGTPLFMAPELWRKEPATRRCDVYSLGVLLYDLCSGAPPFAGHSLAELPLLVTDTTPTPLSEKVPGIDPEFARLVDRCLARQPAERYASGDALRDALEQLVHSPRDGAVPEGNPYRGLLAFEAEHRGVFFGRRSEVGSILQRLRSDPFVMITGDSGIGKSSLCRAGVLPLIEDNALNHEWQWRIARLVPGRHPVEALVRALSEAIGAPADALAHILRTTPAQLGALLHRQLGRDGALLLFIDQFEELITISEPQQAAFIYDVLRRFTMRSRQLRLLATVRSDFVVPAASLPMIGEAVTQALYVVQPMSAQKIRQAIVGPAQVKGIGFESERLIEGLVESAMGAHGSLPLLQFALAELWDARTSDTDSITATALRNIGGVAGALARHADRVVNRLVARQKNAARRMLMALVTPSGTRARRTHHELTGEEVHAAVALEALVYGRLVVVRETSKGALYELAHEALVKDWRTLRRWLDEHAEGSEVRERIQAAAAEWERLGCKREALWSARQLEEAQIVEADALAAHEVRFLRASRRAITRSQRIRQILLIGLPIIAILLYIGTAYKADRDAMHALDARVAAELRRADEIQQRARGLERDLSTHRAAAFSAFAAMERTEGERRWSNVQRLFTELDTRYLQVSQVLEAALVLGSNRQTVRARLADALYTRAVLAESMHDIRMRDEHIERMTMYDDSGERRSAWNAGGSFSLKTEPPARVTLAHYRSQDRDSDVWELHSLGGLGVTPIVEHALAIGSYVLTVEADGHAPVRYPMDITRGSTRDISLSLPHISQVPAGYIYIPTVNTYFGSKAPELGLREFLGAAPLHAVQLAPFLISRHEVTFGDWIDYLEALPLKQRAAIVEASKGRAAWLESSNDGWILHLAFPSVQGAFRSGEPIVYGHRTRNQTFTWQRLPVVNVDFNQAVAYTNWLGESGRVPRARLCTEKEWSQAARGADVRDFPHGNALQPQDTNHDATYDKDPRRMGPEEVGRYPISASPFGVEDMAGNVVEWTTSSLDEGQVLGSGGGFLFSPLISRVDNRMSLSADFHEYVLGIRVCAPF